MNAAGFPRQARLLSGIQFKRVFAARRAESNRYFRIHWAVPGEEGSVQPRLGLAVSKRVARRAVDRNRIRRMARETFRRRRCRLLKADYVVLARPPAADADKQALKVALDQLWLRFESQ